MRAEVERAYQGGGDVYGPPEEETITTVDQLIPDPMPATKPTGTRELIDIHREQQLQKLKGGQERIAARRAEMQKKDEQARWFALAQGMLSPTKTGGFGESLGTTAGLLRQEQEMSRQGMSDLLKEETLLAGQESDIGADYISQLQAQERIEKPGAGGRYTSGRTPVGVAGLFAHPEDPNRDARAQPVWDAGKEEQQFNDDGTPMLDENGEPVVKLGGMELEFLDTGPDGSIPFAMSPYDVARQQQLAMVGGFTPDQMKRVSNDIEGGREAWVMIPNLERTLALMEEVQKTGVGSGGWVALVQGMQNWFGVDTEGVADLGVLQNKLGQAVLNGLKHFPGQISEGERKYMEQLETGLSKAGVVNIALLRDGLEIQRRRRQRGVDAAKDLGKAAPMLSDFMKIDLKAMGYDPDNPDRAPVGTFESVKRNEPGSSKKNALVLKPGDPYPALGTWTQYVDPATGELTKPRKITKPAPVPE